MAKVLGPILTLALLASGSVFAADASKTTLKLEDVNEQKNKVPGDIDEEISNAKLRAESGSKSKWSLSFTTSYYGASLEKPLDKYRPNTSQESTPPRVYLGGNFGMRYRMNKNQSISVGTGYSLIRPFDEAKYGEISDPYLSFNNVSKIGTVQNVLTVTGSATTSAQSLAIGEQGSVSITNATMYVVPTTKLSLGLTLAASRIIYQNNRYSLIKLPGKEDFEVAGTHQTDTILAAYPVVEYAVSDRVQFRTVFRPLIFDHKVLRADGEESYWRKRRWTQSIGVGIAATRDIYLYPNFQFDWYNWQGDDFNFFRSKTRANSTVGLSATINIF